MRKRTAQYERRTQETQIAVSVTLEGSGQANITTPIGFLNHMLEALARHGQFDLTVTANGDLHVDQHHLVEDCGLVLGKTVAKALGDRKGISRSGFFVFPMDEALSLAAVDLSGRPFLQYAADFNNSSCGDLSLELLADFFQAFAVGCGANVAIRSLKARSDHHKAESMFKAFAKALQMAVSLNDRNREQIPSTKGVIDYDWDR